MTLADRLEFDGRIGLWEAARARWLDCENFAAALGDDELIGRGDCARLAILDFRDRLEQLFADPDADIELEEAVA